MKAKLESLKVRISRFFDLMAIGFVASQPYWEF